MRVIYMRRDPIRIVPFNVDVGIYDYPSMELAGHQRVHNRVLDSGLTALWDCFRGVGSPLTTIALGTSATAPAADATGPVDEVWRSDLSTLRTYGPMLEAQYYLASNMCNGLTLRSAMVFAGSVPFAWVALEPQIKDAQHVWAIQWSFPLEVA
ncbi:MAG: hypothetical protein VB144_11480 [Clostridia bacterium]|nr:hypothetical protein [Clostridia bacterium]